MLNEMFAKLSILRDPNMKMCTLVVYPSPLNFSRVLGKTEDKLVLSCKGSFNAGQQMGITLEKLNGPEDILLMCTSSY
jgi:hypothetical protein